MTSTESLIIRGFGALTPLGFGPGPIHRAVRDGVVEVAPAVTEDGFVALRLAAPPKTHVKRKGLAALSRSCQMTAAAVESLLAERERDGAPEAETTTDCGLVVGTAFGHLDSKARFHDDALEDGVEFVSPLVFPNTIINSLAGHAAILFGLRGPNSTVTSGRLSGLDALLRAGNLLRSRRAARVVVAACDEVSTPLLRGLEAAVGRVRDAPPVHETGCFGCVGEGAAAALVELEGAVPGAPLLRLTGWGEATTVGRTLAAAATAAMRRALDRAGATAESIAWLALGGGGDATLDTAEADAARDVFGDDKPAACLKSIFGETFGAGGLLACLGVALALGDGLIPASPGAARYGHAGLSEATRPSPAGPVLVHALDEAGAIAVVVDAP